jgi:hypothetical protein
MMHYEYNHDNRRASYLVSADKTFYVTTIIWVNESVGNYGSIESGIRDLSKHRDGTHYGSVKEASDVISFDLCPHNIWPLELGHQEVLNALRLGIEPKSVYEYLDTKTTFLDHRRW